MEKSLIRFETTTPLTDFAYSPSVKYWIGFPLVVMSLVLVQGCSGPSLEGTWTVTPAEKLPVEAKITTTFAKPDKVTTVVDANISMAGVAEAKLKADANGTWKLEADKLAVTTADVKLSSSDGKELPGFIADQAKGMIKDNLTKGSTGTLKWEGNDKFTVTLSDGKVATFDRVKG